ncbi:O-succinylbenzoic acid--CoA ligase [Kurthia huakuii]|nr:O-succinylbenzoic acid--CoA ligase [Kurthia huakuii]
MNDVVPNWITQRAMISPHRTALRFDKQAWTYKQLNEQSKQYASKLITLGIERGDRVAIYAPSTPAIIQMMLACMQLKCEMVLLNLRLSAYELAYQLDDAAASAILVADELVERLPETAIVLHRFSAIEAAAETPSLFNDTWDDAATMTIMYTSGTTGFPKGVRQTVGNHVAVATSSLYNTGLRDDDAWLCTMPLFHISGFSMLVKCLVQGVRLDLYKKFDEKTIATELVNGTVSHMSVVAVTLERLITELEARGAVVSPKFQMMLAGGGPVPESYLLRGFDRGIHIAQTYGMTETASQVATLSSEDALRKIGSAGKPLFFNHVRIDGALKPGDIGEICVKSAQVTPGYIGRFSQCDSTKDGWLHTGDVGYLDAEGYLYVVDRRSDLIISGGENIYPAEIENVLAAHPAVKEVGVCGIDSDEWGQVPAAFIVAKDAAQCTQLEAYCQERLAHYKVPKSFHIVEELPRNGSNKLMRRHLKDLL